MMVHDNKKKLKADIWYLDIGCSNHMCGSKSFCSHLNEDYRTTVSFGDNSKINVIGKCDVQIRTNNDRVLKLCQMFFMFLILKQFAKSWTTTRKRVRSYHQEWCL